MNKMTRREFVRISALGAGSAVLSYGLMGCSLTSDDDDPVQVNFDYGVASGDPLADRVILWTRVTPLESATQVQVSWEVATDSEFTQIVTKGSAPTTAERDYTLKVDAAGLTPDTSYYYRFSSGSTRSAVGRTRTLPEGAVEQVKLAVISCSNYPAGYFHVLAEIAKQDDLNAALHLGDYIYEYARGGYASDDAATLGREVMPAHELVTLADYRTRYAQYRSDSDMQAFHAALPLISVWDDHEIANNSWRDGAENHQPEEGEFSARKAAAIQAYFEWLPTRPFTDNDNQTIYRSFRFGDLVDLHMLDSRLIGRDKQLDYADYIDGEGNFDAQAFETELTDPQRSMLGGEQFDWLNGELANDSGVWQVLGQQTLMGRMTLPASIAMQQISVGEFAELAYIAQLAARAEAGDPTLTADELSYLSANQARLTPENIALLQAPAIPYNLDAWDGYDYEREMLFAAARAYGNNLVVLAGDTHNSWANNLKDMAGNPVGVEFAASSVSSPGMESYLGLTPADEPGLVQLVDDLQYTNITDRGYLSVTFTETRATADWQYVSSIKQPGYSLLTERAHTEHLLAGQQQIAN